ncbi:MAG: CerR family C-terminal domain-containing protein [Holophagales bacterium]|nr:CerR family C-terminal domain-containing protein [Holophagales bacterium]
MPNTDPTPPTSPGDPEDPGGRELDTKGRLLQAGMEAFAERGFADASIRQICARAGANAAAVNYHFGDKQRFYAEVLATCHMRAWQRRPIPRLADFETPALALRAWIRWFLEMLTVDGAGPLGRLMAREMADPTHALDELILRSMAPMMGTLREIVDALIPDQDPVTQNLSLQSIAGQCLFYRHVQPVFASLERLAERGDLPPDRSIISKVDLERLADHITDFSLAGLEAVDGGQR